MIEGVGEKLRSVIKCVLSNFHEVMLKKKMKILMIRYYQYC